MAKNTPIGGTGTVRVNGRRIPFRASLTWNFQTHKKTGVAGRDNAVHGFTTEPTVPFIEGDFTWDGGFSTRDLEAITNAVVAVVLADGRQLVLRGAYVAGDIQPELDEAKCKLKFEGDDGEEIPAPAA
jgi:hypothetical protein